MLQSVQLLDLRNLQVLAEVSYVEERIEKDSLDDILGQFYEVYEDYNPDIPFVTTIDSRVAYVSPLKENVVLVCLAKKEPADEDELERIRSLGKKLAKRYHEKTSFEPQQILTQLADRFLLKDILLVFFSSKNPAFQNKTGTALSKIIDLKPCQEPISTLPFNIGPYRVQCKILDPIDALGGLSQTELNSIDVVSIVFSSSDIKEERVERLAEEIYSELSVPILIVPGSDKELQTCREFEEKYELMLCDSVSEEPLALLLSVMAIAGFIDMHPELAMARWRIESLEPESKPDETSVPDSDMEGHQEFLVIDKDVAETLYAYLYEENTEHQRAPNVIAAISTFRLDQDSAETFVIRTGLQGYAIVEQENLLFTLITGLDQDLEDIRSRFRKLPALYLENPPPPLPNPGDLYAHPPFTLKLLATIPPYSWPSREVPIRSKEPDWDRFRFPMMKDFLHAVWDSINSEADLGDITMGSESKMTLGGLYFLRRMGAIDTELRIYDEDIPVLLHEPHDDFMKQYNELREILEMIDGVRSLSTIADTTKIEISIVTHVFKQMYARGYVDFRE
ncbi:MAG: hypothetical protein R6V83_08650 [Candidatus Thorarchaeota archaeon]